MKVTVQVGKVKVSVSASDVIGQGGEATVYRYKGGALKIFHTDGSVDLADKEARLVDFPQNLPPSVIGPTAIARDRKGRFVGYAMQLVEAAYPLAQLARRRFRDGKIENGKVMRIFDALHRTVRALHDAGVVLGDLNPGNVLVDDESVFIIDADSIQLPGHPCRVAHPAFLDPRFHGKQLGVDGTLDQKSDWFSFAVLLFQSLLYVHPYGGVHPKYATMLRRAAAGISILRDAVKKPRVAAPSASLGAGLLDFFHTVFEGRARAPFPARLLTVTWQQCACGQVHAASRCPACACRATDPPPAVRTGRVTRRPVFQTSGRIVAARRSGQLLVAYEEDGFLLREDGTRVCEALPPHAQVLLAPGRTWVLLGPSVVEYVGDTVVRKSQTGAALGRSAAVLGPRGLVSMTGDQVVRQSDGKHVGTLMAGRTVMHSDGEWAVAVHSVGRLVFASVFDGRKPGVKTTGLAGHPGTLTHVEMTTSDAEALLRLEYEDGGTVLHRLVLLNRSGEVLAERSGDPNRDSCLSFEQGMCVAFGTAVVTTEAGLMTLRVDPGTGRLMPGTTFAETKDLLEPGMELCAGPATGLTLVGRSRIDELTIT